MILLNLKKIRECISIIINLVYIYVVQDKNSIKKCLEMGFLETLRISKQTYIVRSLLKAHSNFLYFQN